MSHARRHRGFTLLEAMVAISILAVSLVAIFRINGLALNTHIYAKKLTVATLLARSKMVDLQQELYDKPLPADDDEDEGDFSEDGWPSYRWRSKIIVPKTNGLSPEQLFGALFNLPLGMGGGDGKDGQDGAGGMLGGLFGSGKTPPGGTPPGGPAGAGGAAGMLGALGPMAAMAQQQFTQMVDQLQKSVREVHLTVSWKEGKTTESIDLVTHVVSFGPGSDRNGGAAAAAGAPGGAAGETWVRADNGMPVGAPRPGPGGGGMVDPTDGSPLVTAAQYAASRGGVSGLAPNLNGAARSLVPPGVGTIIGSPGGTFR